MKQKLRIGILVDDYLIPNWASKMVNIISESNHSEIVLIVKKKTATKKKKSIFIRIWNRRKIMLYILFRKLDTKIFKSSPDAFELKDIRNRLGCPKIEVHPKETKYSDIILNKDLIKIRQYNVDVFIRLGFRILRGEILNSSTYGIWSYHHGDNSVNRGGPAGVWEVLENWDETGVTLQILTEDLDGGILLDKSLSSTNKFSFSRNRNKYYWKALSMVPRKLDELFSLGEKVFFDNLSQKQTPFFYYNRLFKTPSNNAILKSFIRLSFKKIHSKITSYFYFEQWILLFRLENQQQLSTSFFRFKKIIPPKDRFWADPFIFKKNDNYYIFIEELIYKENKGKISVIRMDKNGNYSAPEVVLERNYHLSYPFLIEENEELYMIPESAQNRTIELYKCIEFPNKWEFCTNLMENVCAVDSTIIKMNNKYWLFCNMKENDGASTCDELFLFYSESLLSQNWTAHSKNPIVSDVKSARPAGNFFLYKNKLFRPSQNCSKRYGYGMNINEVIELSESSYKENTIQSIYPNWERDIKGTHTIVNNGKLTVIDAIYKRRK